MCGSMIDIQSPTAKIRRGKKKKEERKIEETTDENITFASATHGGHNNHRTHHHHFHLSTSANDEKQRNANCCDRYQMHRVFKRFLEDVVAHFSWVCDASCLRTRQFTKDYNVRLVSSQSNKLTTSSASITRGVIAPPPSGPRQFNIAISYQPLRMDAS